MTLMAVRTLLFWGLVIAAIVAVIRYSRRSTPIPHEANGLVCIEDLGGMDVLTTDKTGTLTEGRISYRAAVDPAGEDSAKAFRYGLLAIEEPGPARWQRPGRGALADLSAATGDRRAGSTVGLVTLLPSRAPLGRRMPPIWLSLLDPPNR